MLNVFSDGPPVKPGSQPSARVRASRAAALAALIALPRASRAVGEARALRRLGCPRALRPPGGLASSRGSTGVGG